MKFLLIITMTVVLSLTVEARVGDILDEYDWIGIAKNETEFQRIFTCLLQEVPCDNLQELKEKGIELFKTSCGDCTPEQKVKFEKMKDYMLEAHPKEFEIIQKAVSELP